MFPDNDDITALKKRYDKLESDLEKLSNEYSIVFNGTQDLLLLVDVHDEKTFSYKSVNRSFELSSGYVSAQLEGKTFCEVYGELLGKRLEERYTECLETRRHISYQEASIMPSGKKYWHTTLSPIIKGNKVVNIIASIRDITEIKLAADELANEKEELKTSGKRLKRFFNFSPNPIILTDYEGKIFDCNRQAVEKLEYESKRDMIGKTLFELIIPEEHELLISRLKRLFKKNILQNQEYTLRTKTGQKIIAECSSSLFRDASGKPESIMTAGVDITARKLAESEIRYLTFHDKLTGLYNRAFFESELERLDTKRQFPLSLIIGDLNGLKLTNDIFGHYTGDDLLKKVAGILKSACREEDIISRWGGDEFAIILPKTTNAQAYAICDRIITLCGTSEKYPIQPSIALGYATKDKTSKDIHQVLKEAENWMYRHKLLDNRSVRSSLISSLGKTLFEKNFETEEHAQRIKLLSLELGKVMGLSSTELDELSLISLLHDIGKIAVPDQILMKPGKLTPDEWTEIKKHPEIGYRIAESTVELSHISEFILSHHERWDGTGYPRGLKGTEIPKLSRIISILDAYDVMTNVRPYKGAVSKKDAIAEILKHSGKQFDPEIAALFAKMVEDRKDE